MGSAWQKPCCGKDWTPRQRPQILDAPETPMADSADPAKGRDMTSIQTAVVRWLPLVRGEFRELPALHLTKPQVQRLWGLDPRPCDALLATLGDGRCLRQTRNGTYRA